MYRGVTGGGLTGVGEVGGVGGVSGVTGAGAAVIVNVPTTLVIS